MPPFFRLMGKPLKMKHLLIVTLMSLSLTLEAQITVSSTDIMNLIGKRLLVEQSLGEMMAVMPGQAGPEQNRDFSFAISDSTFILSHTYLSPENTPYADTFSEANFVQKIELVSTDLFTTYTYSRITESEFVTFGSVSESRLVGPLDTSVFLTGGDTFAVFPLSYEKTWTEVELDTLQLEGLTSLRNDTTVHVVDSYGVVKVPAGSFACLRVRSEKSSRSKTILNGIELPSEDEFDISYDWISKEAFVVAQISSMSNEENPNFSMASSFSRLVGGATGIVDSSIVDSTLTSLCSFLGDVQEIQVFPNPARGRISLSFSLLRNLDMSIEIKDLQGRKVNSLQSGRLQAGRHEIQWRGRGPEGRQVPSGIYWMVFQSKDRFYAVSFFWE